MAEQTAETANKLRPCHGKRQQVSCFEWCSPTPFEIPHHPYCAHLQYYITYYVRFYVVLWWFVFYGCLVTVVFLTIKVDQSSGLGWAVFFAVSGLYTFYLPTHTFCLGRCSIRLCVTSLHWSAYTGPIFQQCLRKHTRSCAHSKYAYVSTCEDILWAASYFHRHAFFASILQACPQPSHEVLALDCGRAAVGRLGQSPTISKCIKILLYSYLCIIDSSFKNEGSMCVIFNHIQTGYRWSLHVQQHWS